MERTFTLGLEFWRAKVGKSSTGQLPTLSSTFCLRNGRPAAKMQAWLIDRGALFTTSIQVYLTSRGKLSCATYRRAKGSKAAPQLIPTTTWNVVPRLLYLAPSRFFLFTGVTRIPPPSGRLGKTMRKPLNPVMRSPKIYTKEKCIFFTLSNVLEEIYFFTSCAVYFEIQSAKFWKRDSGDFRPLRIISIYFTV